MLVLVLVLVRPAQPGRLSSWCFQRDFPDQGLLVTACFGKQRDVAFAEVSGVCLGAGLRVFTVHLKAFSHPACALLLHMTCVCWWKVSVSVENTSGLK